MFYCIFKPKVAGKYKDVCEEYILLLKLRIYLFISFTQIVDISSAVFLMGWFSPPLLTWGESLIYAWPVVCILPLVCYSHLYTHYGPILHNCHNADSEGVGR